jgi:hypothetical protein
MSADLEERLRSLGVGNAIESKRPMALRKFDTDRENYSIVWATPEVCLCSHKKCSRFTMSKSICHGTICASEPHSGMMVSFILSTDKSQPQIQTHSQSQTTQTGSQASRSQTQQSQTHLPATSPFQGISKSQLNSSERLCLYLPPYGFDMPPTSSIGLPGESVMFGGAPISWGSATFRVGLLAPPHVRPILLNDGYFATSDTATMTHSAVTIAILEDGVPSKTFPGACAYSITEREAWSHQYLGHFAKFESILIDTPIFITRVLATLILQYLSSFWTN